MIEALHSSETSVLTRDTRRNVQEDGILHSQRLESLESYLIRVDGATAEIRTETMRKLFLAEADFADFGAPLPLRKI
jgi:hypothetical protein